MTYKGYAIRNGNRCQTAFSKSTNVNRCYAFGNYNRGQTRTTTKGLIADGCNAVWNSHRCQATATFENLTIYSCHAVGDGDGGQAAAIIESPFADGCHAIGDGDGGQAAATSERLGIVTEVRLIQLSKAKAPMKVTPLPIIIEVKPVQSLNE